MQFGPTDPPLVKPLAGASAAAHQFHQRWRQFAGRVNGGEAETMQLVEGHVE